MTYQKAAQPILPRFGWAALRSERWVILEDNWWQAKDDLHAEAGAKGDRI